MALRLKEDQLRAACAKLRAYLAAGETDHKACEQLGMSWADFEELKARMMEFEVERVKDTPPEQIYVEYLINQESNIQALTDMIGQFQESRQATAMVGAVKARAEIYDKMIAKGQEFGFVKKVPERQEIVAGIMVATLSNEELRAAIAGEMTSLHGLMDAYGTKPIIDVTPGKLHYSMPPPAPQPLLSAGGEEPKQHARNKVHKGRRVTKEKAD